ncbi:MAG: pilus assembly PilX family protein [Gammaproteobacteria bacterium]
MKTPLPNTQTGVALVISLVMLASLTLIAVAGVDSSSMGLRLARIVEEQANAFQTAQAAVDQVISDTDNLPMTGPLDTAASVTLTGTPFAADAGAGETISADASRTADCALPPRVGMGTSMLAYSAFSFRVNADVDRVATGRGQSAISQGYLILGPKC